MHTVVEQPRPANVVATSSGNNEPVPVIFTVHGTFDAQPDDDGALWWQRGSVFHQKLLAELEKRGIPRADYRPFHWSGANTESHRRRAAGRLGKLLLKHRRLPTVVIGHSHGGNVIVEALPRVAKHAFPTAVTFGTPFLLKRLKPLSAFVAWAIFLAGFFSNAAPIMLILFLLGEPEGWKLTLMFGPPWLAFLYVFPMVLHKKRTRYPVQKLLANRLWLTVHSLRDEAIIALANAAALRPSYIGAEAAQRTIVRIGTFIGVAAALIAFPILCARPDLVRFLAPELVVDQGPWDPGVIGRAAFYLPSIFAAVFSVFWIASKIGGARLYASLVNSVVHGGVIGAVYGTDNAYAVKGVSLTPMNLANPEDLHLTAETLGHTGAATLPASLQSIYGDIVGAATSNSPLDPNALWKRMSSGLYHNAYMQDQGVIEAVADHIAICLKERQIKPTMMDRLKTAYLPP